MYKFDITELHRILRTFLQLFYRTFARYPLAKAYDSLSEFEDEFMAKELSEQLNNSKQVATELDSIFENHYEQFSQLKGTLQVEKGEVQELFLWGGRGKTVADCTESESDSTESESIGSPGRP